MFRKLRYLWAFLLAAAAVLALQQLSQAADRLEQELALTRGVESGVVAKADTIEGLALGMHVYTDRLVAVAAGAGGRHLPWRTLCRPAGRHGADDSIMPASVGRHAPVAAVFRRRGRRHGAVSLSAAPPSAGR